MPSELERHIGTRTDEDLYENALHSQGGLDTGGVAIRNRNGIAGL